LEVLLINDFGQNPQSIGLKHIIIGELHILCKATNDDEYFVLADIQLLDQHINESSQVLIQLVSLRLRNLEQLGHIEEKLTFLVFSEYLTLVQQEYDLIQEINALLVL
jgi:hypothetical protein